MSNQSPTESIGLQPTSWAMSRLGYRNPKCFLAFVKTHGVPHVRLNARTIRFDPQALEAWIEAHSSNHTEAVA